MVKKILALYLISFFAFPPLVFAEETEEVSYDIVNIKKGDPAPFDGILLSPAAAAQIAVDKKFEDADCELRIEYELQLQKRDFELQLSFKDVEIHTWQDKYEAMMILKTAQVDDLRELVLKPKPANGPLAVALGFGIGTLTSIGIFAVSTEILGQ